MEYFLTFDLRAINVQNISEDQEGLTRIFFGHRLLGCSVPLMAGLAIPDRLADKIGRCSDPAAQSFINDHLPQIRLSLSEKTYREEVAGNIRLPFDWLAFDICEATADQGTVAQLEVIIKDYERAGWVRFEEGMTAGQFWGQCRYYVYTQVLPKLMTSLKQAAKTYSEEENGVSRSIIAGISKYRLGSFPNIDAYVEDQILQSLKLLSDPDMQSLSSYQDGIDLSATVLTQAIGDANLSEDEFRNIVRKVLNGSNSTVTPFVTAFNALNQAAKDRVLDKFTRLLSHRCSDLFIDRYCVSDSRVTFAPYLISIENLNDQKFEDFGIGGLLF